MLLEPCLGGELYSHMQLRRLQGAGGVLYAACVVSAFEHATAPSNTDSNITTEGHRKALHSRNVLYRDLKPENVVIASNGYIKVVDSGFAKRVYLLTVCGTPEYLAPELIMMKGHSKGVDCGPWRPPLRGRRRRCPFHLA